MLSASRYNNKLTLSLTSEATRGRSRLFLMAILVLVFLNVLNVRAMATVRGLTPYYR